LENEQKYWVDTNTYMILAILLLNECDVTWCKKLSFSVNLFYSRCFAYTHSAGFPWFPGLASNIYPILKSILVSLNHQLYLDIRLSLVAKCFLRFGALLKIATLSFSWHSRHWCTVVPRLIHTALNSHFD
jgi:hypothetical protein